MSILLKEGRKEDLKKKYSDKFDDEVLDDVLGISDLQDFNHKYTDFILKALDIHSDIDMMVDVAVGLVKDFDKYQSQLKKKDINQYNSFTELETALKPFIEKEKEKELEKQVDKVYEDNKFLVIKPKTEEASCKYGAGTKWCVTQKGSGHFGRYTQGNQQLYFIIDKKNSTNKEFSKVAVHFSNRGDITFWDSQDNSLTQKEINILKYAFPEVIDTINKDYEKTNISNSDKILIEVFNKMGETSKEIKNYLKSNYNLSVFVGGFQNISDLGFGHSEGFISISLISDTDSKLIDQNQILITYESKSNNSFTANIEFLGMDEVSGDDFEDLGLEDWSFYINAMIQDEPYIMASSIRNFIANKILDHIKDNKKIAQKVSGTPYVWSPTRGGYTFGKNKGLIKKLVDYLDLNPTGTKLDFLEYIGKLTSKIVNNRKQYAHSGNDDFMPSVNWRGHFASFFSAAKQAGILNYRKVGNQFYLVKGPNFQAFKEGKLKAL